MRKTINQVLSWIRGDGSSTDGEEPGVPDKSDESPTLPAFPPFLSQVDEEGAVKIHYPQGFYLSGAGPADGTHEKQVLESIARYYGESIAEYLLDSVRYSFSDGDVFTWELEFMVYKQRLKLEALKSAEYEKGEVKDG